MEDPLWEEKKIQFWIKRDDQIHPVISGNKYRKLAYLFPILRSGNCPGVVSYGGPFSNHIHALSWLCKGHEVPFTAFVRSRDGHIESPTLEDLRNWGTTIIHVPPHKYAIETAKAKYLGSIGEFPNYLVIPEGGGDPRAQDGIGMMMGEIEIQLPGWDVMICPVGTGATLSGIINYKDPDQLAIGISALKSSLTKEKMTIEWDLDRYQKWTIADQWHFGGYGKVTDELLQFIKEFKQQHEIMLDPLYNGKAMFALYQYLQSDLIPMGSKVVFIHTGGLQGWRGIRAESGE